MSFTTVEDLFAEAPGFRERAKAAHAEAQAAKAREYRLAATELMDDMIETLRTDFGVTGAELADIDFEEKAYNASTPCFVFEIDGVKLRARYIREQVMLKKSSEFEEERVYDEKVGIELFQAHAWKTVKDLTSLGAHL